MDTSRVRLWVVLLATALMAALVTLVGYTPVGAKAAPAKASVGTSAVKATGPGNTLKLRVKGDRLKKRAPIVVKGLKGDAKGYKKVVRVRSVKKLTVPSGKYKIRAKNIKGGTQVAKPTPRLVKTWVTAKKGKKVTFRYGVVPAPPARPVVPAPPARPVVPALPARPVVPAPIDSDPANSTTLSAQFASQGCTPAFKHAGPGDDTINVDVAAGVTTIVCPGLGTDTINIDSVASPMDPATKLWIAMGNGAKTIKWNALGDFGWIQDPEGSYDFDTQFLIVRPFDSGNDPTWITQNPITLLGAASHLSDVAAFCNTNLAFQSTNTGDDFYWWGDPDQWGSAAFWDDTGSLNLDTAC